MSADRLAAAILELAQRAEPADVRAQLHALAGIVANLLPRWENARAGDEALGPDGAPAVPPDALAAFDAALAAGDEAAAVDAMRELGARGRALVRPIDWSAASRG